MLSASQTSAPRLIVYVGKHADPTVPGSKGYLDLYTPRAAAAYDKDETFSNTKVLYACLPGEFENEYEFMLACKATRLNTNYYMFNAPRTLLEVHQQFKPELHSLYNPVSGDKLPANVSPLLVKCMLEGVFVFMLMHKRGVGDYQDGKSFGSTYTRSRKPHSFKKGDDTAMNVSNVFMGMLIDYYRISTGAQGVDAQISFMRSEQYRIAVYIHMRDVFNAFVRSNDINEERTTTIYDGKELCDKVVRILMSKASA